jgi:mannose-1-phosphate guanylyltransferase
MGEAVASIKDVKFHRVAAFREKPNLETAEQYLEDGNFLWNGGIFVWRAGDLLQEIKVRLPELYSGLEKIKPMLGTAKEEQTIAEIYPTLPSTSVDYGILEKTLNLVVVPADFDWDDLGSWGSLERYLPKDDSGNVAQGELIGVDTKDCIVYSPKKTVVGLGVADLIVVETDDVLLVCAKNRVQDIKKILEKLKTAYREDLL